MDHGISCWAKGSLGARGFSVLPMLLCWGHADADVTEVLK